MSCDNVITVQDLETDKKHSTFYREVITGKAGGTGADIDSATNPVTGQTQATLPELLSNVGFSPAGFDFTTGGTLTERDKAIFYQADGNWYSWGGALPKVVPPASSPASTGGIADNAWNVSTSAFMYRDWEGFTAELLAQAGIVDNGQPDELGNSQRVTALNVLYGKSQKAFSGLNDAIASQSSLKVGDIVSVNDIQFTIESSGGLQIATGKHLVPFGNLPLQLSSVLTDSLTSEKFSPALRGRLMTIDDAYKDVMLRSSSGVAQKITCYGDSNTRYYQGDTSTPGPYSRSYGAFLDIAMANEPSLYGSEVIIKGFPSQTASFGLANFDANVPSDSDFVVIGFGTNNVKLSNANMDAYMSDMLGIIVKCLNIGALPIVLGIPWYSENYGSDGVTSQRRLKTWNSTLYSLCSQCNVPFVDTYNMTRTYTSTYFNEVTLQRHYSAQATKQIAARILEEIKKHTKTADSINGVSYDSWGSTHFIKSTTGVISRDEYTVGKTSFETLSIASGGSITIRARGRGCVALYPRAAATVTITYGSMSITESITPVIDAGEYYPVKRIAIPFDTFGAVYDCTISTSGGSCFIRTISFEDSASDNAVWGNEVHFVSALDLPTTGMSGRAYFVTQLGKVLRWSSGAYLGESGVTSYGTTAQRDAVAVLGLPNGYKFWNTTTARAERYNQSTNTWVAV